MNHIQELRDLGLELKELHDLVTEATNLVFYLVDKLYKPVILVCFACLYFYLVLRSNKSHPK
jgi:hypothetical protein